MQVTQSQQDTTPPTLTIPNDLTIEATDQSTTVSIGTGAATDDIDPNPTITNNATSSYPVGTTKILWTATDSSNNYSTALQTITIQDTTPPTLTIPNDFTVESIGSSTAVFIGSATATDLVDSNPTISNNSTGTFPIGSTAILWTVTDSFGNSNNAIQTITVQDTTPPVITLNGEHPQTIQLGDGYTELGATTNDGSQVIIDSSSFVDSLGSYSVFYDSEDAYGNDAIQVVRTVNVVGPIPTLTIPDDITIEATGQFTTVDIGIATATDDIDPNPTIKNNSTSSFPVGITAILWTATNSIGNQNTAIQTITVTDTTPPTLIISDDITAEARVNIL